MGNLMRFYYDFSDESFRLRGVGTIGWCAQKERWFRTSMRRASTMFGLCGFGTFTVLFWDLIELMSNFSPMDKSRNCCQARNHKSNSVGRRRHLVVKWRKRVWCALYVTAVFIHKLTHKYHIIRFSLLLNWICTRTQRRLYSDCCDRKEKIIYSCIKSAREPFKLFKFIN